MEANEFKRQNREHAANTKALLAGNFLDTAFITNPNRFQPKPFTTDALGEVLIKYGELFTKGFAGELAAADANASGALTDSVRFEFEQLGQTYNVNFIMNSYAKFVDLGVQGINKAKSINNTSPFRFKFARPSAAHVAALEKWIKQKNVTAIITVPKGITNDVLKARSLAQAIGYATKQRGLKATYFKRKTVEKLIDKFKAEVIAAAGNDIKINVLF